MTTSSLYNHPDLYDLVMTPIPQAEAFYVEEARKRGGPVLDLACGTGRLTLPFALAGLDVVGVDESPAMLDVARAKAAAAGVQIELVRADMRELDLPRRDFGLVVVAANSLLHMLDTEDIRRCLHVAARHLRPDGALAFDVFVPDPRRLARDPRARHEIGRFEHPSLGSLTLEETMRYDPARQVNEAAWLWSAAGQPDFVTTPLHLRQIFPQELPLLLELEGFRLSERYGDFDRSKFGPRSPHQICICAPAGASTSL